MNKIIYSIYMANDKYILFAFLIFIILFMSYWNTHKIEQNSKDLESFTSYYNSIYNETARNCRYLNRDVKEYFDSKISGITDNFGKKKK
uniref:Uncharacterized protein n=1 Tax=viral metagenome TaxID=1070528 RepID=A0A6C0AYD5_9ZZZZ|tara:strand:+ start:1447 stop:1713 length:267 start_codon:yes stop_codon:yes gene_type:complete